MGTWDGLWEHKLEEAGGPLFQVELLTLCLFLASGGGSLMVRGGLVPIAAIQGVARALPLKHVGKRSAH